MRKNQLKTKKSIRHFENQYKLLFNNMPNGFALHKIVLNANGRPVDYVFLEINHAFEKLTGLKKEKIIGKKITEVLPGIEKESANWIERYGKIALTGKDEKFEQYAKQLKKWYSVYAYSPKKGYFATIFENVNNYRKTEDKLNKARRELQTIFDSMPAMAFYKDRNNRFIRVNKALARATNKPKSMIEGTSAFKSYPENAKKYWKDDKEVMASGKPKLNIVEPLVTARGEERWVQTHKIPYKNSEGKIIGIIGFATDITALKKAQEETKKARERFEGIYNASKDAIGFANLEGVFLDVNNSFCKLTGYSEKELTGGKKYQDLTPEEYHEFETKIIAKIVKTGKPEEYEKEYIRKNGTRVPILLTTFVVKGIDGKTIGVAAIIKDATELKKAREAAIRTAVLKKQLEKQKEIDAIKTDFISLASHQLNTPLININWYLEMLLEGDKGNLITGQKAYLSKAYQSSQSMTRMVNNLLNVSRIDLDTLKVNPRAVSVVTIIKEAVEELKQKIRKNNLKFILNYGKNIPRAKMDPELTLVIFQNVLSNAVEYNKAGGEIRVNIAVKPKGWSIKDQKLKKDSIVVTIADTGYGIPQKQQKKIFVKMFRASNIINRRPEGSGIGLYVTKSIISRLGGNIWVTSKENVGTNVYVSIPIK